MLLGVSVYRLHLQLGELHVEWLDYLVERLELSRLEVLRWALCKIGKSARIVHDGDGRFPYPRFKPRGCSCRAVAVRFMIPLDSIQFDYLLYLEKETHWKRGSLIRFALKELYERERFLEKRGSSLRNEYGD